MVIPYWTPRGNLAGAEFRTWGYQDKKVRDYRTPNSKFSPVFLGLTNQALHKIWEGGDVWLVEGIFDLALAHVVPEKDVVLGCGTARLTNRQLDFLERFLVSYAMTHVVYDEDETGRKHAEGYTDPSTGKHVRGVVSRLESRGIRSRHVRYRGGKDPGEIWESGGRYALRKSFPHLAR